MTAVPPPPKPTTPPPKPSGGLFLFVLFGASLAWIACSGWIASSSATGLSERLNVTAIEPMLSSLFWIFLLLVGFSMLQVLGRQGSSLRVLLGLPRRTTAGREWALGAVLGWASVVTIAFVLALTHALQVHVSFTGHDFWLTLLSLLGLGLLAFAEETAFRGYPYRLLIESTGPSVATLLMAVLFGVFCAVQPFSTPLSTFVSVLLGLVLAAGWLRTHALWVSWGFNFAFKAAAAVLFGLARGGLDELLLPGPDISFRFSWVDRGKLRSAGQLAGADGAAVRAVPSGAANPRLCLDLHASANHPGWVPGRHSAARSAHGDGAADSRAAAPLGADSSCGAGFAIASPPARSGPILKGICTELC